MPGERKKPNLNKILKPQGINPTVGSPRPEVPPEFRKFLKGFMEIRGDVLRRLAEFDKGHE